ncbi:LysR family transcriptional regulator [Polynucleobacter sp. MWH-Braz-FAM2G]|uniref:LysR family transcriptional regulator n=1 Tax=Polynucleobacter sp. MWH-Braz-FAM2G TaxID=1855883 RepID=UPI001BFD94B8|nr:LysR family transcriptional regulator [Polynucleobacter sp. MWH-Braz-FAM2G]QWD90152.1 LysR family transcriptional regulator [Polynucleobacter sp. MWH-Braz-FAM2G]
MLNEELTLRKLEILCSFVRTGSLSKTAEEMRLSSVSIHKALHSLESGVGCPLFVKDGRQLKALPAATYLAEASIDLLADLDRVLKKTRAKAGVESSQIRLGSMYSLTANIIPRMIMGTKIRRSDLDIDLYLGSNEDLMKRLTEGSVDAVVIAVPSTNLPDGIQVVPLFEDQLYLASSKSAKPAHANIDLSEYQGEKFLTLKDGFATTSGFYEAFQLAGFKPNVVMKVGDIFSLMNMVSGNLGRTLLPGRVKALMGNAIEFTPLLPKYQVTQHIGLMYLQANESNPNILALAAEARMLHRNNS